MALGFTQKAKNALLYAEKTAKQFQSGYVGTEHLLLGLIRERTGVAAMVLKDNHVDETRLEELIQEAIVPQGNLMLRDRKEYSVKAARVLEESKGYARKTNAKEAGTEHILMALIRETDSVAVRLLAAMGINPGKVYMELLRLIGDENLIRQEEMELRGNKKKKKDQTSTLDQYSRDLTALAGKDAIRVVRLLTGVTNGREALPGTIRGDFSMSNQENIVHASSSADDAAAELKRFFKDEEIMPYTPDNVKFLYAASELES